MLNVWKMLRRACALSLGQKELNVELRKIKINLEKVKSA